MKRVCCLRACSSSGRILEPIVRRADAETEEGGVMRAVGKPPEEWIDRRVVVSFPSQESARLVARLDGISDRGVILTPIRFSGEGRVETNVFYPSAYYPWDLIGAIRLARENERV